MIVSAKIGIFRRTSALTVCFLAVCDPKQARRRFTRPLAFPFFVLHHTLVQFLRSPVKEIGAAPVQSEMTVATNSLYAALSPLRLSGLSINQKNSVSVNMRCSIFLQFYVVTLGLKCAHIKLSGKRQSNGESFFAVCFATG